jgi:hypothetical protein
MRGHFNRTPHHLTSHGRNATHGRNTTAGHNTTHGNNALGGNRGTGHQFSQSAHVTRAIVGSVSHGVYGGHRLSHQVVGNRHRSLVGHHFRRPGHHLHNRLGRLRGHRWHRHFKHVVIVGAGGALACDLYCEFDVPLDVYGDFVAAVDEAQVEDVEAAAYAQDEPALTGVAPAELPRRRRTSSKGWNKAVAILEEAAAEDDKKVEEKTASGQVETVIDQPDERVDVILDGDEANKG